MAGIGRHVSRLGGYAPALPTPFGDSGDLDVAALERLCRRQLEEGATALVVCGTTGEAPTLSRAEHHTIVSVAAGVAQRQIPVIAGAGSNSTRQAVELASDAEVAGADAILSIVPYYNKPTQAGMYAHFRAIAESTGLPIILSSGYPEEEATKRFADRGVTAFLQKPYTARSLAEKIAKVVG